VDPRLLLGVGARAGRSEVRAAHRRLRSAVSSARGGTDELARLVDAAAAVLGGLDAWDELAVDPHAVLGVQQGAGDEDVRAAYRRVARVVHPDLGGTDELFRVIAAAHDLLTGAIGPPPREGDIWRAWADRRTHAGPPPPPKPRGPYRAPPADERHAVPTWRALRNLTGHVVALALGSLVLVAALQLNQWLGLLVLAIVVALSGVLARPAMDGMLRSAVVLLGTRVRVAADVEPERFLEDTCLDAPVGREREDVLYAAYVRWCARKGQPVAPWVFVERLRTLGLLLVKPSSWDAGLWVGVVLRRA
jgi:hypothetical protein